MNISEAIAKRKSVRAYLNKPVLTDDLAKIVEAGQWAPNAGPFQISVVRSDRTGSRIVLHYYAHLSVEWGEQP